MRHVSGARRHASTGPIRRLADADPWTPVSQSPVTGSGSGRRSVPAGHGGRRRRWRTAPRADRQLRRRQPVVSDRHPDRPTSAPSTATGILYRAGDCYLQGDDSGFVRVDSGAPACIVDPAAGPAHRAVDADHARQPLLRRAVRRGVVAHRRAGSRSRIRARATRSSRSTTAPGCRGRSTSRPVSRRRISHETFFSPRAAARSTESFTPLRADPTEIIARSDRRRPERGHHRRRDPARAVPVGALQQHARGELRRGDGRSWPASRRGSRRHGGRFRARIAGAAVAERRQTLPLPPTAGRARCRGAGRTPPPSPPPAPLPSVPTPGAGEPPISIRRSGARRDVWRTPLGMLGFVLLSALLYAFLDPTFGFSLQLAGAPCSAWRSGCSWSSSPTALPLVLLLARRAASASPSGRCRRR